MAKEPYDPLQMLKTYLNDNPSTPSFFKNFLQNRLGDQLTWYEERSGFYKKRWQNSRKWVIVLSATIPFVVGYIGTVEEPYNSCLKFAIGFAGVVIAVLEGFNSLFKSQDLYIDYRVSAEQIKQELSYFIGQAGYTATDFSLLVTKVEAIIAKENNQWSELVRRNEDASNSEKIQEMVKEYLEKNNIKIEAPAPDTEVAPPAPPVADTPPATPPAPPVDTPPATPPASDEPIVEGPVG